MRKISPLKLFTLVSLFVAAALCVSQIPALAATKTLATQLDLQIALTGANADTYGTTTLPFNKRYSVTLTSGTGSGKANRFYQGARTLTGGGTESLDFYGGFTDFTGETINFATVKGIIIAPASTGSTSGLKVGGTLSNQATLWFADTSDAVNVSAGGKLAMVNGGAGWTITTSTADLLKITNLDGSNTLTYDLIVWGDQ